MSISFSQPMLKSIENQIVQTRQNGSILDVYRVAETIRREHAANNVALEDIINHFVKNAGPNCPIEFIKPEWATDGVTSKNKSSNVEVLMVANEARVD